MIETNDIQALLSLYTELMGSFVSTKERARASKQLFRYSKKSSSLLELEKAKVIMDSMAFLKVPDKLLGQVLNDDLTKGSIKIKVIGTTIEICNNTFSYSHTYERTAQRDSTFTDNITYNKLIFEKDRIKLIMYISRGKINIQFVFLCDEEIKSAVIIKQLRKDAKEKKLIASIHATKNQVFLKELPLCGIYHIKVLSNELVLEID